MRAEDAEEFTYELAEGGEVKCAVLYGIKVCVGDFVRIYPRSVRMMAVQGIVKSISANSIVLECEENTISIRLSEIKMLQKPKLKK